MRRWTEHLSSVPYIGIFSRAEVRHGIKKLKNNKAPGFDEIPVELLKANIEITTDVLFCIFGHIWQEEKIPTDWQRGLIVKIVKRGDLT